jgi:hypothetical protein
MSELQDEMLAVSAIFPDIVTVFPDSDPARVMVVLPLDTGREVIASFVSTGSKPPWTYELAGIPRGQHPIVSAKLALITSSDSLLYALITTLRDSVAELAAAVEPHPAVVTCAPRIHSASAQRMRLPALHGAEVIVMKSTFQAHVAPVSNPAQVRSFVEQLHENPRVARATHNILAFRIRAPGGSLIADNDDDGEDAAGERLAHLLELLAADNLCVVVSRWFGGVLMGPGRFKAILDVARDAIEGGARQQGWYAGRPQR